jgi:uncharacterized protein (DUF433 family)
MPVQIIDRGRGPEIEGTRITVLRVYDFVRENDTPESIAAELELTDEEVHAALDYIEQHRIAVQTEYDKIQDRVRRRNPPQIEAGRAKSVAELKQRIQSRQVSDTPHARSH